MKEKEDRIHKKVSTYIREYVFGFEDGIVSTVGVVAGLTTAALSRNIILLATFIEIIVAAFSMAAGTYLSLKAQRELSNDKRKVKSKAKRKEIERPFIGSIIMFLIFIVGGFIVMAPYIFLNPHSALTFSFVISAISLFLFGAVKAHYTKSDWFKSGLEMLAVGSLAVLVGFILGSLFRVG